MTFLVPQGISLILSPSKDAPASMQRKFGRAPRSRRATPHPIFSAKNLSVRSSAAFDASSL